VLSILEGDRRPSRGHRALEGTDGCRGDRGPQKGQRAVERTEGSRGDRELLKKHRPLSGKRAVEWN
jgi:hypothetical protein